MKKINTPEMHLNVQKIKKITNFTLFVIAIKYATLL